MTVFQSAKSDVTAAEARSTEVNQASEARLMERIQTTEARFTEANQASEARLMERIQTTKVSFAEALQASETRLHEEIQAIETRLNKRIDEVGADFKAEIKEVKAEIRDLKVEMKQNNAEIRTELRSMDDKLDQVLENPAGGQSLTWGDGTGFDGGDRLAVYQYPKTPARKRPGARAAVPAAMAPTMTPFIKMAAAVVAPMARRTFANPVVNGPAWAPEAAPPGQTRTAMGLAAAVQRHPRSVVVIGSTPTALLHLLALGRDGHLEPPVLVVGMPVGFVGVREAKAALARSGWPLRLDGSGAVPRPATATQGAAARSTCRFREERAPVAA